MYGITTFNIVTPEITVIPEWMKEERIEYCEHVRSVRSSFWKRFAHLLNK